MKKMSKDDKKRLIVGIIAIVLIIAMTLSAIVPFL